MGISKERVTHLKDNWKCVLICLAIAMANCQYGFDTATIAGFQAMVGFLEIFGYRDPTRELGWNIKTKPQQLISSLLNVGTIVGVLLTGPFARHFGRKPGIWAASLVSFIASGVQLGTTSLSGLYAGRVLIGASNGFFITFANVYTAEASPAHLRGLIVSFFGVWVNIGSILGTIVDNYSKEHLNKLCYQIPLATLYAIPFCLSVLIVFVPESPRWLLVQNKPEQARQSLVRLRGQSLKPEYLEEEFIEMKRGIDEEKELASSGAFVDMFKGTDLRRSLLCFAVILSHSSSGVWLVIAYGTFFFQMAGVDEPFQASIISTCGSFAGVLVGLYATLKLLGRRSMMLIGHGAAALFMLGIAVAYTVAPDEKPTGKAIVACTLLWGFFYNGFSGSLSWPLANELVSSRLRVLSIGVGTAINYFFSWLVSYTAPYFLNSKELGWGPKYAYIWAGSNFLTFFFFLFFLPEMKGRTLEEIDELFQNRVSVRNFPKYECISSSRAREIAVKEVHANETSTEKTAIAEHSEEIKV
ncbi:uncharacterized protein Z518_01508 [Rhinocladiella mackenziei CBS 650.93]|uniref:Major facilitator superfamily (MFS) profile domain-containing protein n=1 Tax=Rhinocladiella mackenziei CBS 650.93 TaxID=1442369 RepID=A0A0D2J3Y9_9EURO|nr:uncharacterized protein Z518_01508 [Rhinocladiella mackenziei CBS 650.93]KIX10426.1 hypothetical protein Z518_01508 [Rhinocladiella mackenziei CBS 650.93]